MRSLPSLLAISLVATSCAQPSSRPVLASVEAPTPADIGEGVAEIEFHGIPGLFFTFEAWRNVLIRHRLLTKDLEISLAHATIGQEVAEIEARTLRASQKRIEWRATWGPPLAFAGGITVAGVLAAVLFAVLLGGAK